MSGFGQGFCIASKSDLGLSFGDWRGKTYTYMYLFIYSDTVLCGMRDNDERPWSLPSKGSWWGWHASNQSQCSVVHVLVGVRQNPVGVWGKEPFTVSEVLRYKWRIHPHWDPCDIWIQEPLLALFLSLMGEERLHSRGKLLGLER